jgi:hypothetical protein
MAETSTQRLRELLRQADVKSNFDDDDLQQIVSSASESSSSARETSSVITPSSMGVSASADFGVTPDDNGSEVSRLSIPSSLLDELHSTPNIKTRRSSHTPQSILKTPNIDMLHKPEQSENISR